MTIYLHHNELTVEVFDDAVFNQSVDSPTSYDKVIQMEKDKLYSPNSQHAIKVYKGGEEIKSGIILASGGGTGVHENTALIDDENLIIRCCNNLKERS